jgi:hypothetical protein
MFFSIRSGNNGLKKISSAFEITIGNDGDQLGVALDFAG